MNIDKESIRNHLTRNLSRDIFVYPDSLRFSRNLTFFTLKDPNEKYLGIMGQEEQIRGTGLKDQVGSDIPIESIKRYIIRLFERSDGSLKELLNIFPELNPSPIGAITSFGFGDRLGIANAAHIRALKEQKKMVPVLAQQSVRELSKTKKDFDTVIKQSMWNILQEGYSGKWGADADHIKEKEYFIKAAEAGMTMYTLDTSEHLDEEVLNMTSSRIKKNYQLDNKYIKKILKEYLDKKIKIDGYEIYFDEITLIRLALAYGRALKFIKEIFVVLSGRMEAFDYEISFDETNTITTPEAHYFIINEMRRSNISFTSLALRFPGTFEKGIDYIGNIEEFDRSINIHALICRKFGDYKLSLHSGSDKLSIYPSFVRNTQNLFHIKTSGTSWLEAVRTIASTNPPFFRELFQIALDTFNENKKAYHINLDKSIIPTSTESIKDNDLPDTLNDQNLRRLFHIAYGAILEKKEKHLMRILFENEQIHYDYLFKNFKKHFDRLKY